MRSPKAVLASILEISEDSINDASSPENVAAWDSFNGLMLISALEKEYGVKFNIEEVVEIKDFRDIKEALKKHGVSMVE